MKYLREYIANELVVTLIVLFVPVVYLVATVFLYSGIGINPVVIPLSVLLLVSFSGYYYRSLDIKLIVSSTILLIALILLSSSLTLYLADYFWDSRAYHGPAIIYLANGWNPVYDWSCCSGFDSIVSTSRYIESYPKSAWLFSSSLLSATGVIETGFILNVFLAVSCWIAAYMYLQSVRAAPNVNFFLSLVIAANPIIVSQLFSHYVDGSLGASITAFIFFLLTYLRTGTKSYLVYSAFLIPFIINIKFTGLIFAAILGLTVIVYGYMMASRYLKNALVASIIAGCLGLVLFGFNPYITNSIEHDNPFYPAIQKDKKSVIYGQIAALYGKESKKIADKDRVSRFLISVFSKKTDASKTPVISPPFTTLKHEYTVDSRVSGFGPLFSGIFLITAVLMFFIRDKLIWVLLFGLYISIFIADVAWWARLVPQTWLIPALIITACIHSKNRYVRIASYSTAALMIFNSMVVSVIWLYQLGFNKETAEIAEVDVTGYKIEDQVLYQYSIQRLLKYHPDTQAQKRCEQGRIRRAPFEGLVICTK